MNSFIGNNRIPLSIVTSVLLLACLLVVRPSVFGEGFLAESLESVGFLAIAVATVGRIWCGIYICGQKNRVLVTDGPYSLHRNPLYVYSFLGMFGVGLAARNVAFSVVAAGLFAVLYPAVVLFEEAKLKLAYGAAFDDYCKDVPRWMPRRSNYHRPDTTVVSLKQLSDLIRDAALFLSMFIVADIVFKMHSAGWLPNLHF